MADTIAAVSTGGARSAIGIIRVSGDGAFGAVISVFRAKNGQDILSAPSGKLILGELLDREGRVVDGCLCVVNRAPRSFTGEDTAELHCHGSPVALAEGLLSLYAAGARPAEPGEFTKRAFLNGKLGLTQAEAVMDIIDAETAPAVRNAAGQLGGTLAKKADGIYSSLLDISSHFHAVIDWPDEDVGAFELKEYGAALENAEAELTKLLSTFERGRIMKDGISCAIIGKPNVGKSSLLNALTGFDRAIVAPAAGTTRDTIEERVVIGDSVLRLTDTAGMRETSDSVEKLGVARSEKAAEEAGLVIAVFDGSSPLTHEDAAVLEKLRAAPSGIAVLNKSDLGLAVGTAELEAPGRPVIPVSALRGDGLDRLCAAISSAFPVCGAPEGELLTNVRQAGEISRAKDAVSSAREALREGVTPDAVLTEVEEALSAIGSMTGKTVREDIIGRIFERFCVGK